VSVAGGVVAAAVSSSNHARFEPETNGNPPIIERRTVLKTLGAVGAVSGAGTAVASRRRRDELRLFGEAEADNAMEVVTQGNYAYIATGRGMAIVDWRNPGRPELVADIEASDPDEIGGDDEGAVGGVLDVKVDGDVAVMAHNGGEGITTVDVSDPENPEGLAFYRNVDATGVHNCYLQGDYAYLTVNAARVFEDEDGLGVRVFGDAGAEVVDVSDPETPEHATTWRLREELPAFANAGVNPNHDLYVQDDLLYNAFWDAGVVVLDITDPTAPTFVAQFGAAPHGDDEIRPWRPGEESFDAYFADVFPYERYLTNPGNAHYVQPAPDGEHTYVGDETFPGAFEEDPDTDQYGGVRVFDTNDLSDIEQVSFIAPPEAEGLRTAHNFDVTANRIHTSWYNGGVHVHDIVDPAEPEELGRYQPDGIAFWTAVSARGFTVGGVYGARSDDSDGGVAVLSDDRGEKRPPAFDGSAPPSDPGMQLEPDER
jgi:hypothetical protein